MRDSKQRSCVRFPCPRSQSTFIYSQCFLRSYSLLIYAVVCLRAKRYERMMKFHGLHQPASALRETFKSADPKEDKSSAPITPVKRATEDPAQSSPSPKKRSRKSVKGIDGENRNLAMDDDEELAAVGAAKIKIEKIEKKNPPTVKEEPQAGYHGLTGYQYPLAEEGAGTNGEEYGDVLSDFLRPEDFETQHESDGNAYVGYGH